MATATLTDAQLRALVQGTPEWHEEREGCPTASMASRLLTLTAERVPALLDSIGALRGPRAGRDLGGVPEIARGRAREDTALMLYELRTGAMVERVGLLAHPTWRLARCSPDGLVGEDGGTEAKCPTRRQEHIQALTGQVPPVHVPQVQFSLWVSCRAWWDFVSYRPEEPDGYELAVVRSLPDFGMHRRFCAAMRLLEPYLGRR